MLQIQALITRIMKFKSVILLSLFVESLGALKLVVEGVVHHGLHELHEIELAVFVFVEEKDHVASLLLVTRVAQLLHNFEQVRNANLAVAVWIEPIEHENKLLLLQLVRAKFLDHDADKFVEIDHLVVV